MSNTISDVQRRRALHLAGIIAIELEAIASENHAGFSFALGDRIDQIAEYLDALGLTADARELRFLSEHFDNHRLYLQGIPANSWTIPEDTAEATVARRSHHSAMCGVGLAIADRLQEVSLHLTEAESTTGCRTSPGGPYRNRTRKPKRRRTVQVKPLTELQRQAIELYAKHNGKLTEIAREMNVKHPTVSKHLKAAWKKLPGLAPKPSNQPKRTRRLPTDRRGQVNL